MIRDGYHWMETSTLGSTELTFIRGERAYPDGAYRVGSSNPRNIYFGNEHVGVMFDPADGPVVVAALNAQLERTAHNRHYDAAQRPDWWTSQHEQAALEGIRDGRRVRGDQ